MCGGPLHTNPLQVELGPDTAEGSIKLSTAGLWCLVAYWLFSSELFDADHHQPNMNIFPEHLKMLQTFLEDEPQTVIAENAGTVEALLVIGLWLESHNQIIGGGGAEAQFMPYHHLLTLCSVFHPSLGVRNVATTFAGTILHADPDVEDRLKILEDLLENCIFASLQACAVTWLREEIMNAKKTKESTPFSTTAAIEALQYSLFPNLVSLKEEQPAALLEYWTQNGQFHMQVANFAYFLFAGAAHKQLVPMGMSGTVEQRYIEPLLHAAGVLEKAVSSKEIDAEDMGDRILLEVRVLADRLKSIPL
jgi:hypothetical protein